MRAVVVAFVLLLTSCAHVVAPPGGFLVADRLYCGLTIPDGGIVTDEELARFVDEIVVPRFPEGFTIYRAEGHYLDRATGPQREPSVVIEIVHPVAPEFDRAVEEIADAYRTRFRQQAVLRVNSPARMDLIE